MTCRMGAFVGSVIVGAVVIAGALISTVSIGSYLLIAPRLSKRQRIPLAIVIALIAVAAFFLSFSPIECSVGTRLMEHWTCS